MSNQYFYRMLSKLLTLMFWTAVFLYFFGVVWLIYPFEGLRIFGKNVESDKDILLWFTVLIPIIFLTKYVNKKLIKCTRKSGKI